MGLKFGSSGFSRNQNNSGSSCVCVSPASAAVLAWRLNMRKMPHKDRGRICIKFIFACVVGNNPKTPNLSPMADNPIARGDIGGLGSPVYI